MLKQDVEVLFNKKISADTFLMGLASSKIVSESKPGQFVMIQVHPGLDPLLRRPFSICGIEGNERFYMVYRVVGRGTAILSHAKEGARLSVVGPLGRGFRPPGKGCKPILVAGGIGIAPLIFLSQRLATNTSTFMCGFPSTRHIISPEWIIPTEIKTLIATDDGSAGYRGPVTQLLESRLEAAEDSYAELFACGPLPMLKTVAAIAADRDIPCQVSMEATMACGLGACLGCAVAASSPDGLYYHVCREGPVFRAESLDWNRL